MHIPHLRASVVLVSHSLSLSLSYSSYCPKRWRARGRGRLAGRAGLGRSAPRGPRMDVRQLRTLFFSLFKKAGSLAVAGCSLYGLGWSVCTSAVELQPRPAPSRSLACSLTRSLTSFAAFWHGRWQLLISFPFLQSLLFLFSLLFPLCPQVDPRSWRNDSPQPLLMFSYNLTYFLWFSLLALIETCPLSLQS